MPYSPAMGITKSGLCQVYQCPVTSWFPIWLRFCVLLFQEQIDTENTSKAIFMRLLAWDPGLWNPGQPPPFDNLAAPRREFYSHQVVWLADLPPLPVLFAHLPLQPDVWSPAHCWLAVWSSVMPTCSSSAQPSGAKEAFLSFHLHSSDVPAFLTFFSGHVPILYLGIFLHGFKVKVT